MKRIHQNEQTFIYLRTFDIRICSLLLFVVGTDDSCIVNGVWLGVRDIRKKNKNTNTTTRLCFVPCSPRSFSHHITLSILQTIFLIFSFWIFWICIYKDLYTVNIFRLFYGAMCVENIFFFSWRHWYKIDFSLDEAVSLSAYNNDELEKELEKVKENELSWLGNRRADKLIWMGNYTYNILISF